MYNDCVGPLFLKTLNETLSVMNGSIVDNPEHPLGVAIRWLFHDAVDNLDIGGPAVDGDVLRAEINAGVIKVYRNGSLVATSPADLTYSDGQPGIGFWPKSGSTLQNYGWKTFEAGNL